MNVRPLPASATAAKSRRGPKPKMHTPIFPPRCVPIFRRAVIRPMLAREQVASASPFRERSEAKDTDCKSDDRGQHFAVAIDKRAMVE